MNEKTTSSCIKEANNWGRLEQKHKFDNKSFDKEGVSKDISIASPKLKELLRNIKDLDDADMKTHKKHFKHFIYSDIKSSYGAKLIASVLASDGYVHAYSLKSTPRGMSFVFDEKVLDSPDTTFATLTSTSFFEKPVGVNFRKSIIKQFNSRPDNIYGDKIRIIILDSGFREGIDLFDVKYVHLIEPISTPSDQKQAIGRATRRCGQKGLTFDSVKGWPLHVYRYETLISNEMRDYLAINDKTFTSLNTFFDLFMKYSNIDPRKIALSNELERIGLDAAVDKELTSAIHSFDNAKQQQQQSGGGSHVSLEKSILKKYGHLKWPEVVVKNECERPPTDEEDEQFKNIAKFTPTQEFIRTYFTPKYKNPGMLLWHSVGTGKTCTAIATASSTFEVEGYTILYVTRHTLKASTWKDMFDNVCSIVVQEYIKKGMSLPDAHAARLRLISKGWFEPMSYRQLSNTLSDKNQFAKDLRRRNSGEDILHKTLIIVDEAHKLFASDVEGPEKADIGVIKDALMKSNRISGKEGAKILLMTATPFTTDAMDLFRLLNLCRPHDDQFPETFDELSEQYLDENGVFTKKSKPKLYNKIAGYISYLNQGKDIRYFAYPIIKDITVPMSEYVFNKSMTEELSYMNLTLKSIADDIRNSKKRSAIDISKKKSEITKQISDEINKSLAPIKKEVEDCKNKEKLTLKTKENNIKERLKVDLATCEEITEKLISKAKTDHEKSVEALKKESVDAIANIKNASEKKALKAEYSSRIKQLQFDLKYVIDRIINSPDVLKCKEEFKEKAKVAISDIKNDLSTCTDITNKYNEEKKIAVESGNLKKKETVTAFKNMEVAKIKEVEERYRRLRSDRSELKKKISDDIAADSSQRMAVDKCLEDKVKPYYKNILDEDAVFNDEDIDELVDEEPSGKKNIYMIMGHGRENVINFDNRLKVPADKVIVVFPVCSRPNYMNVGCGFIDIFNNPKYAKYLKNPIKYRNKITKALGFPIRVYLPDEYIPDMSTDLFLKFETNKGIVLAKSGVFRINNMPPMNREVLPQPNSDLGSPLCPKWCGSLASADKYTGKIHSEVFKKNVFKRATTDTNNYKGLSNRAYKITDIINTVGKGIYYYIGCRTSSIDPDKQQQKDFYRDVLSRSEKQQKGNDRDKKIDDFLNKINIDGSGSKDLVKSTSSSVLSYKQTIPEEPEEPEEPEKPIVKKNTAKEIAKIKSIEEELKNIKEDTDVGVFVSFREDIKNFANTPRVIKLLAKIKQLEELHNLKNNPDAQEKIVVKKVKHNDKTYMQLSTVKYLNKKQIFPPVLYGILNSNTLPNDNKCTTAGIVAQVKKLYRKKIMVKLPKTFEEADSIEVFNELCKDIKNSM